MTSVTFFIAVLANGWMWSIVIEDQNEKSDEFSPTRLLKKSVSAESDITSTLPYLLLLPQVQ